MRKLRPVWELNQPDLMMLGTGCILGPAIPCNQGRSDILPAPEGKVHTDLWYCESGGHSSQQSPPQAEAGAARDAGDRGVKERGLKEGRHRTESQRVSVAALLPALVVMGEPMHSLHIVCQGGACTREKPGGCLKAGLRIDQDPSVGATSRSGKERGPSTLEIPENRVQTGQDLRVEQVRHAGCNTEGCTQGQASEPVRELSSHVAPGAFPTLTSP